MTPSRVAAVLGPTNTGKTHLAIERMLAHRTGVIGLPLRLLAREVYDRIVALRGPSVVALVTGEERIVPDRAAYWVCTVEAMPDGMGTDFLAVDEIQLCADPERGRFRQFVKGVLFHLVADYHKKKKRLPHNLHPDAPEPEVADASTFEQDREFLRNWREELLRRAWAALEESDRASGKHFYKMLRLRAEHPDLSSTQLAELLSKALGKPINAAAGRQTLHRAREQFSDLMLDDVVQSLDNPTREQLEQELIDLGLLEYCRPALERRKDADE